MFVGEGYLALVPSCLPHLRELCLVGCDKVCEKYVEELMAALPELKVIRQAGKIVGTNSWRLEVYWNVCDKYVEELVAALPELEIIK